MPSRAWAQHLDRCSGPGAGCAAGVCPDLGQGDREERRGGVQTVLEANVPEGSQAFIGVPANGR